jgi:hypothetical protein
LSQKKTYDKICQCSRLVQVQNSERKKATKKNEKKKKEKKEREGLFYFSICLPTVEHPRLPFARRMPSSPQQRASERREIFPAATSNLPRNNEPGGDEQSSSQQPPSHSASERHFQEFNF